MNYKTIIIILGRPIIEIEELHNIKTFHFWPFLYCLPKLSEEKRRFCSSQQPTWEI